MGNSTANGQAAKPAKPRPDFPLYAHASGRWAKKVRGQTYYFGSWRADPKGKAALLLWLDQKEDLKAGRRPSQPRDGLTVLDLCNHYMTAEQEKLEAGDIVQRTFQDSFNTCQLIIDKFGKKRAVSDLSPSDFQSLRASLSRRYGVTRLGNEIGRVRSVFSFGYESELIDTPVRLGPRFKKAAKRREREHKQNSVKKFFHSPDILRLVDAAPPQLKAMILLAINAGLGNADCGKLTRSTIDFDRGWLDYPRPKNGILRRCPLWRETLDAINEALEHRPTPKDEANGDLVFITMRGLSWFKDSPDSPVAKEFRKLLNATGLYVRGRGFYSLRHSFLTIGEGSLDKQAVQFIMGHSDGSVAERYREEFDDKRLLNVTDHVHRWLFGNRKPR